MLHHDEHQQHGQLKNNLRRRRAKRFIGVALIVCLLCFASFIIETPPLGSRSLRTDPKNSVKPNNAAISLFTNQNFGHTLMIIIFNPQDGTLVTYADDSVGCNKYRGYAASFILSRALLQNFPGRFQTGSNPFQLLFTSADLPQVIDGCLNRRTNNYDQLCRDRVDNFAPIITFGSAPKDASILPSLHQFPLTTFISCFVSQRCKATMPIEGAVPEWDDLVPQITWRGSDFPTATSMGYQGWMPGQSYRDIDPARMSKEEVIDGLLGHYDTLTPRWRAVVLSLKAGLDVEQNGEDALPWIDAKFLENTFITLNKKFGTFLERYEMQGIPVMVEDRMSESEMSKYKYLLDIGGGSGTSWDGTVRKLAMPGLLFHHETPTRDFFYYDGNGVGIKPWVHYVPLKMDLSDLREKFEWAESHPLAAQKMATAATKYVNDMATDEWIEHAYKQYFVKELGRIVDAYQPMEGETVESMLDEYRNSMAGSSRDLRVYSTCGSDGCNITHHKGDFYNAFENSARQFVD